MDELRLRRMKKCAESLKEHEFISVDKGILECSNCSLTIEEIAHILGEEDAN